MKRLLGLEMPITLVYSRALGIYVQHFKISLNIEQDSLSSTRKMLNSLTELGLVKLLAIMSEYLKLEWLSLFNQEIFMVEYSMPL